jgi:2-oxoglutarate dehydrogenase complex dehydrogenase (E1) component-like enzyme
MYASVGAHAPVPTLYANKLVAQNAISAAAVAAEEARVWAELDKAMAAVPTTEARRPQPSRKWDAVPHAGKTHQVRGGLAY